MIKKVFIIISIIVISISCKKETPQCTYGESSYIAPDFEVQQLKSYAPVDVAEHPSGILYKIVTPGNLNARPSVCSSITVTYKGSILPSNSVFENVSNPVVFSLGGLILGWQKGLPIIGVGGKIDLYIPPSLAYGPNGSGSIPANAFLKFEIQLVDVQ